MGKTYGKESTEQQRTVQYKNIQKPKPIYNSRWEWIITEKLVSCIIEIYNGVSSIFPLGVEVVKVVAGSLTDV